MHSPAFCELDVCFDWVLWHINHCWLFNAKSHQHATIKGMDSYRLAISHMEVRPDR